MSKQLHFSYEGKDYTLEYTKRTIKQMEDNGFIIDQMNQKPMTTLPELFAGAFRANHKTIKRDLIDEIYDHMPNKEDLIIKLVEMYNEQMEGLVNEPDEHDSKKVEWTPNW